MSGAPADTHERAEECRRRRNTRLLRWFLRASSIATLKREARSAARAAGIRVILKTAATILWLAVAGFIAGAFLIWLSGKIGAIPACSVMAAALAIVALVLQAVATRMAHRRHTWHLETPFPGLAEAVRDGGLDDSAVGALAVAAMAGFIIGLRGKH